MAHKMNPKAKLTEEQFAEFLERLKNLAEGPWEEMQKEAEVTNVFPEEFYKINIENDVYRLALPSEYGGWDLSELEILMCQEQFSRGPGGMRMHTHYSADLNWRILDDFGKPEVKAEYMDKFQDRTFFTENGDYIINGEKWLISHTDCCHAAYVIAVTDPEATGDERLSAFMVPCDTPGYEIVPMPHMMGCRGSGHTGLKFTDLHLDKKFLLGEEGQGMEVAMHSLDISRVHIAASNLGMSQKMLEITLDRAADRVTFGKPIIQRQAIKMKLAEMQKEAEVTNVFPEEFYKINIENDVYRLALPSEFSIETVKLVSDEMLEIFGGIGYFEDCEYGPVERLYRDCRAMWLEEGTPTVQRITIARHLIKNHGYLEYNTQG